MNQKLEYILRLLNEGESAEALKEFRAMHGMVNRFECDFCGNISSVWSITDGCDFCGGTSSSVVVVIEQPETQGVPIA